MEPGGLTRENETIAPGVTTSFDWKLLARTEQTLDGNDVITSFEVHNFKSIRSLHMPMRPFMALVGPNGAGKTNVVAALELFGDLISRGNTDPARELGWDQIIRRGKKPARAGMSFTVEVALPKSIIDQAFEYPFRRRERSERKHPKSVTVRATLALAGSVGEEEVSAVRERLELVSPDGALKVEATDQGVTVDPGEDESLWDFAAADVFFTSEDQDLSPRDDAVRRLEIIFSERSLARETERRILRILSLQRVYSTWLNYFLAACEVSRIRLDASSLRTDSVLRDSSAYLGSSGENLAAALDRLRGHEKEASTGFREVLRSLQQVYPRIEDVRPRRVGSGRMSLLVKEVGITGPLAQSSVSDGVLHALALLVALQSDSPGLLAIEEPENAIHPWSVAEIVRRAQTRAKVHQTLLTTHSPVVVDAVADPDNLYIVEHAGSSGTSVRAASEAEHSIDAILKESGQKLGAVWVDGTLGGVPGSDQN